MATSSMATPSGVILTPSCSQKARDWQLTLNEIEKYEELKNYLTSLKSNNYFISCEEVAPTTGHKHIHIYVQFTSAIKLSMKKCCGAHIEKCRGTPQQNVNYIRKDGKIIDELGTLRLSGNHISYNDALEMTNEEIGELNIADALMVKKIQREPKPIKLADWHKKIKVYYICGPSGCGKSLKSKELIAENGYDEFDEVMFQNPFWLGISGKCKTCIYDDWRPSHMSANEFIKFIDYNKHTIPIKGGCVLNNYELIIINSVVPIDKVYSSITGEPREQWMRRLEIIDYYMSQSVLDDEEIEAMSKL